MNSVKQKIFMLPGRAPRGPAAVQGKPPALFWKKESGAKKIRMGRGRLH